VPLVVVADQITKSWIRAYPVGSTIFQKGFFRIVHIENPGAAFGLFQSHSTTLMVIDFLALAIILGYFLFLYGRFALFHSAFGWVALSLIFAGTSGNLIDRLNPSVSGITDFVYIGPWPAFNVADSSISVGVVLLALTVLFSQERPGKTDSVQS
jgi:signal peptidase II